jgi:hypothetical protein
MKLLWTGSSPSGVQLDEIVLRVQRAILRPKNRPHLRLRRRAGNGVFLMSSECPEVKIEPGPIPVKEQATLAGSGLLIGLHYFLENCFSGFGSFRTASEYTKV